MCVLLTKVWVHLLYDSIRPFEISNHCQPSLLFPSLYKPSAQPFPVCPVHQPPNHHGHPLIDVLQLAFHRRAEDTPCAGSPMLRREVLGPLTVSCSCTSVCGSASLTQICASLACDMEVLQLFFCWSGCVWSWVTLALVIQLALRSYGN